MTRIAAIAPLMLTLILAACGGGTAPTPTPAGATSTPGAPATTPGAAATTPGAAATTPAAVGTPQATPPPVQGNATVTVMVTGGPDAGTYQGSADPHCSFGFLGPGVWGVSYGEADMTTGLTGVQMTAQPGASAIDWAAQMSLIFDAGARTYTVSTMAGGTESTISIIDGGVGDGASIHVNGPAVEAGGVTVQVVVNCPSVTRP